MGGVLFIKCIHPIVTIFMNNILFYTVKTKTMCPLHYRDTTRPHFHAENQLQTREFRSYLNVAGTSLGYHLMRFEILGTSFQYRRNSSGVSDRNVRQNVF